MGGQNCPKFCPRYSYSPPNLKSTFPVNHAVGKKRRVSLFIKFIDIPVVTCPRLRLSFLEFPTPYESSNGSSTICGAPLKVY